MTGSRPELSIVVPAWNEAHRIGPTLERLLAWSQSRAGGVEIVVVDDGSSDATSAIVKVHAANGVRLVELGRNRGKGAALRAGVAATHGDFVLVTDADLSTPIEEIGRLMGALREADVAIGSRDLPDSRVTRRQAWPRELAGRAFNFAIRTAGVGRFRDTQCGFKLLRGDVARRLFARLTVERFAYDVELLWLAVDSGHRVVEVGVEWRNDPATRVRVVRDGVRMLVDIVRFRLRHRRRATRERR